MPPEEKSTPIEQLIIDVAVVDPRIDWHTYYPIFPKQANTNTKMSKCDYWIMITLTIPLSSPSSLTQDPHIPPDNFFDEISVLEISLKTLTTNFF